MRDSRQYNKAKKKTKNTQSPKIVKDKVTRSLFADDMIVYVENAMGSIRTTRTNQ